MWGSNNWEQDLEIATMDHTPPPFPIWWMKKTQLHLPNTRWLPHPVLPLLSCLPGVTDKPEPNAFTKCGQDSPWQWCLLSGLVWFGLVWLMIRFWFWSLFLSPYREAGSANTTEGSWALVHSAGGILAGSLPVIARWLQPGPLGKNPHWVTARSWTNLQSLTC